jgi:hypothetical protein
MSERVNALLPCVTFFAAGRRVEGFVNLLMQVTLVLWPVAVQWARQIQEARVINRLLDEFADAYRVPVQRAKPGKRFRGAVFGDEIVFGRPQGKLRRAA